MPFEKGHPKLGGKTKNTKNKKTLEKEERRAVFNEIISEKWDEIVKKLKPEYVADQFLGKARDEVDVRIKKFIEETDKLFDDS